MVTNGLTIHDQPGLHNGRLVLGFSGWMNGGDVSTGTVEWLAKSVEAGHVADIDPEGFYLYSFPGSMEVTALFRPHVQITDGVIENFEPPENLLMCAEEARLVLFQGKEPHLKWQDFADCLFSFAAQAGVTMLYFVGSVNGTVPHTREPRLISTVSDPRLKPALEQYGVRFTNYEGPASFSSYLLTEACHRGVQMATLVAEIPPYIHGTNPKCIESVVRKIAAMLGLELNLDDLRSLGSAWETRLNEVLEDQGDELFNFIHKLEEDYDNDVFDTQMGDLKEWLEQKGIRVD